MESILIDRYVLCSVKNAVQALSLLVLRKGIFKKRTPPHLGLRLSSRNMCARRWLYGF